MPLVDKLIRANMSAEALDLLVERLLELRAELKAGRLGQVSKPARWKVTARPPKGRDGAFWQLRIYPPGGGGSRQESARPATTEEEACAIARAREAELNGSGISLEAALRLHIEHLESLPNPKANTLSALRTSLARVARPLGVTPPTRESLMRIRDQLRHDGLASSTVNTYFAHAAGAWNWAHERGLAAYRWPKLRRLKERKTELAPCTPEETAALLEHFNGLAGRYSWAGPYFSLLAAAGSRVTETLLLEGEDVDREAAAVTFRADRTKTETWRRASIPRDVVERLPAGPGRLWPDLNPQRVRRAWRQALTALGYEGRPIRPHSLRRGWITDAFEAGVPLPHIMAQVGHTDAQTTLVYQQRATRRDLARSSRQIQDFRAAPTKPWGAEATLPTSTGGNRGENYQGKPFVEPGERLESLVREILALLPTVGDDSRRQALEALLAQLDDDQART